jgi:ribosomal protein S12 methylthiotransferase
MRRPERRARLHETLRRIRETIPDVAIRSTVIVGFPGETEDDVRRLLEFLEEAQLDNVGVFPYSAQEGTRAAAFADDVPDEVKRERCERVLGVQRAVIADRQERLVGRWVRAMVDDQGSPSARARARTDGQAEEIDGVTHVATDAAPGSIIELRITGSDDGDLTADPGVVVDAPAPNARGPVRRSRALPMLTTAGAYGR